MQENDTNQEISWTTSETKRSLKCSHFKAQLKILATNPTTKANSMIYTKTVQTT